MELRSVLATLPVGAGNRTVRCSYPRSDKSRCLQLPAAPAQPNRNKMINSHLLLKSHRLSRNSAIDGGGFTAVSAKFLNSSHNNV